MKRKNFTKEDLIKKITSYNLKYTRMDMALYIAGFNGDVTLSELLLLSELKIDGFIE